MNKVVTINLNGRAYQLEEAGFEALRAYLDEASQNLADDPGKEEIVSDLEQAIAEKCDRALNPHKSVVLESEVKKIIEEMGPVEGGASEEGGKAGRASEASAQGPAVKRLYRIEDGSMIWGVCSGLAAFFDIDVTLTRILFVALAILTGGGFCLAYFVMMLVIPEADTSEQKAAARGEPFNAQELVNRAKAEYVRWSERLSGSHEAHLKWKHEMKRERKERRRAMRMQRAYAPNPLLGLGSAIIAIVWILALLSLLKTGAIFGWAIPAAIPLWVSVILLFVAYHAVTGPLRGARQAAQAWDSYGYAYREWDGIVDGMTVLFLIIAFGWAYLHVPEFYAFVHHPATGLKQLVAEIKSWWR